MGLLPFTSTPIVVEVADRVIGDTKIKQKATFVSLTHTQENGESRAQINLVVSPYAASGDGYGDKIEMRGIIPYYVTLGAANDTIVNAQTGAILAVRGQENNLDWYKKAEAYDDPVMFQGDFFELLREQPIKIGDLIREHIAQADGFSRFAA